MYSLLIVDDEDLARYALRKMISRLPVSIEVCAEAENAASAREMAARLKPDIVIMDINMPGMNGLEAARQIQQAHPDGHILVVSAHDSFAFAQRAVQLQLDGYLLKPVRESDFAEEIARITGRIEAGRRTIPPPDSGEGTGVPYPHDAEKRFLSLLGREVPTAVTQSDIDSVVSLFLRGNPGLATLRRHVIEFIVVLQRELSRLPHRREPVVKADFFEELSGCSTTEQITARFSSSLHDLAAGFESRDPESLLNKVSEYLESHALREVSLERVSDHLGMTPQYLSRVFKERYGKKFLEFATERRIERAKELLLAGQCSVAEAGRMVGYADPHYFSRLFRQTTGFSPRAYVRSKTSD